MHDAQSGCIYPHGSEDNTCGIGSHDPDKRPQPRAEGTADRYPYKEKKVTHGSTYLLLCSCLTQGLQDFLHMVYMEVQMPARKGADE